MTISFSGLGSNLDTTTLISQLVAVEKQPAQLLATQQSNLTSQKSIVDSLSSAVSSLGDLVGGMALGSELQFRAATASDAHVSVAVSSDAVATTHAVRVDQLARAQVVTSKTFASSGAGVLGDGGVTMNGTTVTWSSTDSLASIASKINGAKAGVAASVLYDGTSYRLVMSSLKTGTANATTFADSGDGLDLANPANVKIPAQDAKVTIDGVQITRGSNVIDDALAGTTITAVSAQAAGDPDTQVAVSLDHDAVKSKLQSFVDAYNKINSAIAVQLDYTGTTKGANTLFGDSTLSQLQSTLQGIVSTQFGSTTLLDLGVSFDKTGAMSLDADKLDSALAADPDALANLFASGGLSQRLSDLDQLYTRAGDGILTTKSRALSDNSADLQKQIDQINSNADSLQTRLEDQFNALEETMSKLTSQASYVSKILAA